LAIPDFQSLLLPVLRFAADGAVHTLAEAREALATHFGLTTEDRAEMLPSGRQRRFDNRVAWAKVYLEQAGLITSPRRGHLQITARGRSVADKPPGRIDIEFLEQFEEFRRFRAAARGPRGGSTPPGGGSPSSVETPEEILERAYQSIRAELASEVLARVKRASPQFFERLVVELLLKMGYGRSRAEAGRAIGSAGDEGIDGIISEDRLGLDTIYIQAKRWEGTVGRPEIQKFVGALHGKRARKGVFITSGVFSSEAVDYVSRIDPRVVLIDGRELAEYMLDLNLGVTTRSTYELKRIDSDYFAEE
jgi:restriction system protein